MSLAPLTSNNDDLSHNLSLLFEPSPVLINVLVPQLTGILSNQPVPVSYASLIDLALKQMSTWQPNLRAQFVAGHPRIGAVKIASGLSAKEQGAATSPETTELLANLNLEYERRFPGLTYITFVNGRSREEIALEIQERMKGLEKDVAEENSAAWVKEVDRAVTDVGLIAKSRLRGLGAE